MLLHRSRKIRSSFDIQANEAKAQSTVEGTALKPSSQDG